MNTAESAVGFSAERLERLTALLKGYVDRDDLAGLSVLIGRRGQIAYCENFGWRDREARLPIQDDTLFTIASMTKPITCTAIMTLYEQGHFQLNTPIARFIPAFEHTK